MTTTTQQQTGAWTEVEYSSVCVSPYLSTPVFVPKEAQFVLCREDGSRKPARLSFVVFRAEGAADDEWEDDPMPGHIQAGILGDGDEEVAPVRMVNLGMEPSRFISVVREDDQEIVFDINWPGGEVHIDRARLDDEGYVMKKADFGAEGLACTLIPDHGQPFTVRLVVPRTGFSLTDADGNRVEGELTLTHAALDSYRYAFVGSDGNDRFAVTLDDNRQNYLCVLRTGGTMAVRDMRDRLAEVGQIPDRGPLARLLMGAHQALVKNKNNRWRITLTGGEAETGGTVPCDAVQLARHAFERFMALDGSNGAEDALARQLMLLEQKLAFQWYWLDEADWSHEHMDGLMDMEGLDADPEKMMRQALLFNRYETFMRRLAAFSYASHNALQGDQLQARNNKRKIARCVRRVRAHREGEAALWTLPEDDRREILTLSHSFHREFTEALEAEGTPLHGRHVG